jgi:hypothetical protein
LRLGCATRAFPGYQSGFHHLAPFRENLVVTLGADPETLLHVGRHLGLGAVEDVVDRQGEAVLGRQGGDQAPDALALLTADQFVDRLRLWRTKIRRERIADRLIALPYLRASAPRDGGHPREFRADLPAGSQRGERLADDPTREPADQDGVARPHPERAPEDREPLAVPRFEGPGVAALQRPHGCDEASNAPRKPRAATGPAPVFSSLEHVASFLSRSRSRTVRSPEVQGKPEGRS